MATGTTPPPASIRAREGWTTSVTQLCVDECGRESAGEKVTSVLSHQCLGARARRRGRASFRCMLSPSRVFAASPARALALIRVIPSKPVAGMGGSPSRHRTRDAPVGTAGVVANAVASDATDATDAPPVLTSANLRAWIDARNDDGAGSRVELVKCPNDTPDVESSATALGVPVDSIVKSIVFACDGCFAVCVTNGTARVDHKKIARRLGLANKRVRLATRDETVAHAGYVPGTVPPFGHRTKLRTFVALDVVNDMAPDDVVFGGGGCVDVEVRCTVRDLVRLCEPCEVMDVKRDDDVRERPSADASTIATKSLKTLSADVSRTDSSDANDLPVPIDPSLDERTGPNALPIAKRVADVVGQTPTAIEWLSMPAWPATRPADGDPHSPHRVVTATAEVTRIRRVARFLAFATLRPLAPLRIAPKCENGDAGEEEEEEEEEEVPLAPGTTLQLIAGRTLLERMGGEAGMETTLRGLRPGAVLAVTGRLQANPRPLTVDVVSSGISFVDGTEAVTLLAHAERDGYGLDGDDSSSRAGIDSMPPGSAGVTHTAWSRHKRLDKKREKKQKREGLLSRDDDDVPGGVPMSNDELRAVLRGLRMGERLGKTSKFPALPRESVTWVDSVASIHEMRYAVLDPSTRCDSSPVHDGPEQGDDGINHDRAPWVVGLDAEWRPHKHSPVALMQVAIRHRAFLVDVATLMKRPGDDGYVPGNEEAFDHFLRDLFAAEEIVRLGFGFAYDLQRLRRGYAGRLHSLEISESEDDGRKREPIVSEFGETGHPVLGDAVVDVKAVALCAFPGKQKLVRVGLATVVSSVLGAYVDKTEQCRCVYFYFHTGNVTD